MEWDKGTPGEEGHQERDLHVGGVTWRGTAGSPYVREQCWWFRSS